MELSEVLTSPTSDRCGGSWIDMFLVRLPYRGAKGQETLAHTVVICLLVRACVCVRVCVEGLAVWLWCRSHF